MIGKTSGYKIFLTNKGIVALQSLQDSCLSDMHSRFYESSKLKKWMCELYARFRKSGHIFLIIIFSNQTTPHIQTRFYFMLYVHLLDFYSFCLKLHLFIPNMYIHKELFS